jgi:PKD repeat protein
MVMLAAAASPPLGAAAPAVRATSATLVGGSSPTGSPAANPTPAGTGGPPPNWGNLSLSHAPPASPGGVLAYDPAAGEVVWVGGPPLASGGAQTWSFARGSWTNLSASTGAPPFANGPSLAYDPVAQAMILVVAPADTTTMLTWEFSGGAWTNLTSSVSGAPAVRQGAALGWDPSDAVLVLFGGAESGTLLADTWTYNGTDWGSSGASPHPSARAFAGLTAEGSSDALLAGGQGYTGGLTDTWRFAADAWTEAATSGVPARMAVGPAAIAEVPGGGLLGFDGSGCAAQASTPCHGTVEWTGSTWTLLSSQAAPAASVGLELAYDAQDGYVLAFGGTHLGFPSNATWAVGGPVGVRLALSPANPQPPGIISVITYASGGYGVYTYNYTDLLDCPPTNVSAFICPLDGDDFGNYTITVTVFDQLGNRSSTAATTYFWPAMVVLVAAQYLEIDAGQTDVFTATVLPGSTPVNYTWTGLPSDCGPIWSASITCTPNSPGFYPFYVTVNDTFNAVVVTGVQSLSVNPRPSVEALPDRGVVPVGSPVTFHAFLSGGTAPFTFDWEFGDGGNSTLPNATHRYAAPGNFTANLTVTDATGATASWTAPTPVRVAAPLVVRVDATGGPWTAPTTVHLAATVSGGLPPYRYNWTGFGGAIPGTTSASALVAFPGTYPVQLVVTDADNLTATGATVVSVVSSAGNATAAPPSAWATYGPIVGAAAVALLAGVGVGYLIARRRQAPAPEAPPPDDNIYH